MADEQQSQHQRRGRPGQGGQPQAEKIFEEYVINIDRVARVFNGGRRFRFKALAAVGDKKNRIGIGVAKGADVQSAVTKAVERAKRDMKTIPIYKGTIPHEVEARVGGAHILLKPAAPGTGLIAGGVVRSIVGLTGISNLLSKSLGSTNKVNCAYATLKALEMLVPYDEWVTTRNSKEVKPEAKATPKKPAAKKTATKEA
ncbi:MAG TPA: 30S ribosomal protein S5 [Candidatus Saccharimonadales bacterium]|nr:30S ribosomal protein S5 [Candidatus Saccharimonadales bacterium]